MAIREAPRTSINERTEPGILKDSGFDTVVRPEMTLHVTSLADNRFPWQ